MPNPNKIFCGDAVYEVDVSYKEGARAMRQEISYHLNPFRHGTEHHDQWSAGHTHEEAGEHVRFGIDVIEAADEGREFQEDPWVPRDSDENVDMEWYERALAATSAGPEI